MKAEKIFKKLLKTRHSHLISKKTGLMLGLERAKTKGRFKLSYDEENEGAWLGNSPVGARIVTEKTALRAIRQFPKKIERISKKVYMNLHKL